VRFAPKIRGLLSRTCKALTREAGDDDEWTAGDDWGAPLQLVCGRAPGRVVYVTKSNWLTMCDAWSVLPARASVITRYSPVPATYVDVVRCEMRRMQTPELTVVGDLDPLDLTVLLSLACGGLGANVPRRAIPVQWRGVRDDWLNACDRARRKNAWRGEAGITMTAFERRHWARLKAFDVPWSRIIGERSMALLDGGQKMELEGVSNPAINGAGFERHARRLAGLE
jgi:hypothetical protein